MTRDRLPALRGARRRRRVLPHVRLRLRGAGAPELGASDSSAIRRLARSPCSSSRRSARSSRSPLRAAARRRDARRDEPARPAHGPTAAPVARHADRAGDDRAGDDRSADPPAGPTATTLTEWTLPDGYTLVLASSPATTAGRRPSRRAKPHVAGAAVRRDPGFEDFAGLHPGYFVVFSGVYVERRGLGIPRRRRGSRRPRTPGHALTAAGVARRNG